MHDIEATEANINLLLTTFIKVIYLTYSHYLELMQASNQMKSMTFQKLVKKVADREKAFGKNPTHSTGENIYLVKKEKSKPRDSSRGDNNIRE